MHNLTKTLALAGALLLPALGHAAAGKPTPKVTPAQAEAAATKKIPGKALSATYEFEDGHWQYAVLIKNSKGMYEVAVNSTTGKILSTERTSAAQEATEAIADKAAAAKAKSAKAKH